MINIELNMDIKKKLMSYVDNETEICGNIDYSDLNNIKITNIITGVNIKNYRGMCEYKTYSDIIFHSHAILRVLSAETS